MWYAVLFRKVWCMNHSDFWPSDSGNVQPRRHFEFGSQTCKILVGNIKYDLR